MQTTVEIEETKEQGEKQARVLPAPLAALNRVSWNYWWSWSPDGVAVFRDLDPAVWEECEHNPRKLLEKISEFRLMQMAIDPVYTRRVAKLAAKFDDYVNPKSESWAKNAVKELTPANPVAYFCAEYGIHNSLPLYSGGLGMLAGDHLKSASDLGLPLVAIGLLYRYGYFRQRLTRDGWQEEHYGEFAPSELSMRPVLDEAGAHVTVEVFMRGRNVRASAWRVDVGRVPLYLLDTNIPENDPTDCWVTGHLYGGDRETRIVQEMMLGLGGVRLLRRLGYEPQVFHLNEGHSALLTLELARELVEEQGVGFAEAARRVRERCVFTTHTPVAAGNDEFDPALLDQCLGETYWQSLGLTREEFLSIGRVRPDEATEFFGMTPLAIKMSRSTNGVSRKHGEVSQELWRELWPESMTAAAVPITYVTNGVHAPTWVAPNLRALYTERIGKNWMQKLHDPKRWAKGIGRISDEELWQAHRLLKQRLVAFIRQRSTHAREKRGESAAYVESAGVMFDPESLIVGFARRVAGYKRWSLLLADTERLSRLINDAERPVQFVFAGKAHPQDQGAKLVLQQLARWKLDPSVMRRAVFLEDYDQEMARQLVQSVDVWMNVPRRPLEASGTSGQKVAMNGGLNFSVLDGWWLEGYDGTNGWAIGDTTAHEPVETPGVVTPEDMKDAESLYRVLEEEIVPAFYERDETGLPRRWVRMMKRSLETLAPAFSSDRMVQEYAQRIYLDERQ
ncbi:MAG: alpha-glucan family phosphorylase [Pyrinomonadaceae bacterium]|nr:alpha-glucan family phosphorylase [Pyrinomonadaceae bacterium]